MVAFTELCIDLYWLLWKISPTNGCHVFMLIKLVLVLFVKVQLLTILDSGHMLHRNRLLKSLHRLIWKICPAHGDHARNISAKLFQNQAGVSDTKIF